MKTTSDFKPGLHRHYKGGYYWALGLVAHHDTGKLFVKYIALREPAAEKPHLGEQIREYENISHDHWVAGGTPVDAWTDLVDWPDGVQRQRFVPVDGTTLEPIGACVAT